MELTETKRSVENTDVNGKGDLSPFFPKENPRMTEAEQERFEKKARVYFHDAVMKTRGKQWDTALADAERALKISIDLGWKEGIAHANSMKESILQKRSAYSRESAEKVARARYDKRRSARLEKEATEHERLRALEQASHKLPR